MRYSFPRKGLLLGVLLILSCIPVAIVHTQSTANQSEKPTQQIITQYQNDWLFLQEIKNINNNGNYLQRNATYFLPVSLSEVNTSIQVAVKLNNWYFSNTNPLRLIFLVISSTGTQYQNGSVDNTQTSFSMDFQPNQSGIWKVIMFFSFNNIILSNTASQGEANVDIQVSVYNLKAAVSFQVNEYQSWSSLRKVYSLRSFDPVFSSYFYLSSAEYLELTTEFAYTAPTIFNITFTTNDGHSVSINYSNVWQITGPIVKRITFPVGGIWNMKIYFNNTPPYTVQDILLSDATTTPVKMYLNPATGSSLFIDNNYDGFADVSTATNSDMTSNTILSTNSSLSTQNQTFINHTIMTMTTFFPIEPILLGVMAVGFLELRRRYRH